MPPQRRPQRGTSARGHDATAEMTRKTTRKTTSATASTRSTRGKTAENVPEDSGTVEARDSRSKTAEQDVKKAVTRKGRGRPRKASVAIGAEPAEQPDSAETASAAPRRRGRPAKSSSGVSASTKAQQAKSNTRLSGSKQVGQASEKSIAGSGPRRRGRPSKATSSVIKKDEPIVQDVESKAPTKKRGRPAKATSTNDAVERRPIKRQKVESEVKSLAAGSGPKRVPKASEEPRPAKRKRGRPSNTVPREDEAPKKKTQPEKVVSVASKVKSTDSEQHEHVMQDEHGRRFWLMKAEPESRIDKGHAVKGNGVDVKFSIDDLAAKTEPEPWTGVRNLVASRNMREMKLGDLAFFYHSSCKVPGVAGIMEIVEEAKPDEEAFDESSPYYDSKSDRDSPKWLCVGVEFRQKMPNYVDLKTLRSHDDDELKGMELLRLSRLSVSKVSKAQWDFIMQLAGAEPVPFSGTMKPVTSDNISETDGQVNTTIPAPEAVAAAETETGPTIDEADAPRKSGIFAAVQNFLTPRNRGRAAAPRATSVGAATTSLPPFKQPTMKSRRASSAQPSAPASPEVPATAIASVAEDSISGAVPPTFTLRSPSPKKVGPLAKTAVADPMMPVPRQRQRDSDTAAMKVMATALNAARLGFESDALESPGESADEGEIEENTRAVLAISREVGEAMEELQREMDTTIMS